MPGNPVLGCGKFLLLKIEEIFIHFSTFTGEE